VVVVPRLELSLCSRLDRGLGRLLLGPELLWWRRRGWNRRHRRRRLCRRPLPPDLLARSCEAALAAKAVIQALGHE